MYRRLSVERRGRGREALARLAGRLGAVSALSARALAASTGTAAAQDPPHAPPVDHAPGMPRHLVLSDIGNEPDDQMSFARLLVYANEFRLEGLVATTSTWQREVVRPDIMRRSIDAYEQVRPKLLEHASGYPHC